MREKAYFQNVLLNVAFITFLVIAFFDHAPFVAEFYAYLASLVVTLSILGIYGKKTLGRSLKTTARQARLFSPTPQYLHEVFNNALQTY